MSLSQLNDRQKAALNELAYLNFDGSLGRRYEGRSVDAILSSKSDLNDTQIAILENLKNTGMGNVVLEKAVNNNPRGALDVNRSGFCAVAFKVPSGRDAAGNLTYDRGFSFRGTENLNENWAKDQHDMVDNVVASLAFSSVQISQAKDFFNMYRDLEGNNYVFGHSKGGNLAFEVYADNYNEIKGLSVINPQPPNIFKYTPAQLLAFRRDSVDIIVVDGDFVSSIGWLPKKPRLVRANPDKNGFVDPHHIASIQFDGNNAVIETDLSRFLSGRRLLQEGLAVLLKVKTAKIQLALMPYNFLAYQGARIYEYVKNDLIKDAKAVIQQTAAFVSKLSAGLVVAADKAVKAMTRVYDYSVNWFNHVKDRIASTFGKNDGASGSAFVNRIDSQAFEEAITAFRQGKETYISVRTQIQSSTDQLTALLKGEAATAFSNEYEKLRYNLTNEEKLLIKIADNLEVALNTYKEWDTMMAAKIKAMGT